MEQVWKILAAVAAVLISIKTIYGFVKDNYIGGKKVVDNTFEKKFKEELQECLPEVIEQGNQQLMAKLQPQFDKINATLNEQGDRLDLLAEDVSTLNDNIELLNTSSKDVLRKEMLEIYRRGKNEKRIGRTELQTFNQLYVDYAAEGGNSYMHDVHERVNAWEIYEDY